MADDNPLPPKEDPGSEISDHVNDYLENLRSRFNELTDRIEEASRASIDRGRAELEDAIGPSEAPEPPAPLETPAPPVETAPTPPADPQTTEEHDLGLPPVSERLAARLRELEAAEAAENADNVGIDAVTDTEVVAPTPPRAPMAVADTEPPPPAPMPRPVNTGRDGSRRWLVGSLLLLILLAAAFLAGRWWSSRDDATAAPTTNPPVVTTIPDAPSDAVIRVAVDEAIAPLAPSGVVVDVTDGVVMLSGSVPEAATRQALSDVVSGIAGVRQIDNRVEVALIEPPTAEEIQAEADEARAATGLDHLNVSVVDGVATITGVVSVDAVADGVFASVAPLRDALLDIDGIDSTVTRVQLRGDEAALRAELKELTLESPIIFASGSPDLDETSIATLDQAAEIILSFPGLRVLIAGHTDAAGATQQNEALATARGQVVLGYLISKGVPITRLQVVSYGELFPEAGAEQSLNRRIEFEVAP